jgi:hypothetical protein
MKISPAFFIVIYTTQAFMCVVGGIGIRRYKLFSRSLRIIEWYILSSIFIDLVKDVMVYFNIHTLWLSQCFSVLELSFFASAFYSWRTNYRQGTLFWLSYLFYLSIWIIGKFSFESFSGSDVYSGSISQLIQISIGIWLLLSIQREVDLDWKNDSRIWVISGIVFYATATFLLFGLFEVLLASSRNLLRVLWLFNDAFIVIQYTFFLRAFLCKPVSGTAGNIKN